MQQSFQIEVLIAHSDPLLSAGLAAALSVRTDLKVAVYDPERGISNPQVGELYSSDIVVADYDSGLRLMALNRRFAGRTLILTDNYSQTKICDALAQGVGGYLLPGCSLEDLIQSIRSIHVGGTALDPLVARRITERTMQEALTRREDQILDFITSGLTNKAIALKLTVTVGTVKSHVRSILRKLDAGNRTEAVAIARRRGIVRDERKYSRIHADRNIEFADDRSQ